MGEQIKVTGMVIKNMPIGEYDSRVVLLTRERGEITVFAKGARRQNSPFLAGTRPFAFGEFTLYGGRSSYGFSGAEIKNYFTGLSETIETTTMAFYFLELSEYFAREGMDGSETVLLLYASFLALQNKKIPDELVRSIFELKTLTINGIYPNVFSCAHCGTKENLRWLSEKKGTVYCEECKEKAGDVLKLTPSLLYTMQFIISKPVKNLYTFVVTKEIQSELEKICKRLIGKYVHRTLHSLEIMENL